MYIYFFCKIFCAWHKFIAIYIGLYYQKNRMFQLVQLINSSTMKIDWCLSSIIKNWSECYKLKLYLTLWEVICFYFVGALLWAWACFYKLWGTCFYFLYFLWIVNSHVRLLFRIWTKVFIWWKKKLYLD